MLFPLLLLLLLLLLPLLRLLLLLMLVLLTVTPTALHRQLFTMFQKDFTEASFDYFQKRCQIQLIFGKTSKVLSQDSLRSCSYGYREALPS